MTETAPKRYAKALIIHFVIVSLFFPTFKSEYWNAYYQDFFLSSLLGGLITINILFYWKLNWKQNLLPAALLTLCLALYNAASFHMYHTNPSRFFWKCDHLNVTLAFLFFIALLWTRDIHQIVSDKVIKWTIRAIVIGNLTGLTIRIRGFSHIQMMNFIYWKVPYDESNDFFGWFSADASEYALTLLLAMSFFVVYKEHFKNLWTYLISQAVLLLCLILTNSSTYIVAAAILFGFRMIHLIIQKCNIPRKYVLFSLPCTALLGGVAFSILFSNTETFIIKSRILKGTWRMLLDNPLGLGTSFSVTTYYVDGVPEPLFQAHNVFLNHMLRHSLTIGILFTVLFLIIIICSILRRPTYQTIGIWAALLLLMNTGYSLQTLHLPFTLFLLYCIFFRPDSTPTLDDQPSNLLQY